jgi:hypothetical protein
MFITLLVVTLILAAGIAFLGLRFFRPPLRGILHRIVGADAAEHWYRFAVFALYITSVGHGVQVYRLDRYIQQVHRDAIIPPLSVDAWVYEIYQVIERTLEGLAWGAMTIFIIGLLAIVVLRAFEIRRETKSDPLGEQRPKSLQQLP